MTAIEECLKNLADAHIRIMPEQCEKLLLRVEFWGSSMRSYSYFKLKSEFDYRDCAHLQKYFGITEKGEDEVYDIMEYNVKKLRTIYHEAGLDPWNGITVLILPTGEIKCDFDNFDQLTTEFGSSRDAWKAKYLV